MTHHPAHPNLLPLLHRMPWKRLSEQYLKPGEEPKWNRSLAPSQSFSVHPSPHFSPLRSVVRTATCWLSLGHHHVHCGDPGYLAFCREYPDHVHWKWTWLDFCGGVLLSSCCQGKMLCYKILMYSITVRVCSWINWLNMYIMADSFPLPIKFLSVEYLNLSFTSTHCFAWVLPGNYSMVIRLPSE